MDWHSEQRSLSATKEIGISLGKMSTITEARWPQARHVASILRRLFFRIWPRVMHDVGSEDQIIAPLSSLSRG